MDKEPTRKLSDSKMRELHTIAAQVRQAFEVWESWSPPKRYSRGPGLPALFLGPPGTGKTLAVEQLSRMLGLKCHRIDLSTVTSKYIGETEKNLDRVFGEADRSKAILMFDEADALFGRRSEVGDAHDRYANLETNHLFQRIENHPGLVILTANSKECMDDAFLRRIRFVVQFP